MRKQLSAPLFLLVLGLLEAVGWAGEVPAPVYFAQIGDGAGFSTTFTLVNPNTETAVAQLSLFNSDGTPKERSLLGTPTSVFTAEIPPGTSRQLILPETNPEVSTGWAALECNVKIAGVANFKWRQGGKLVTSASVLGTGRVPKVGLPVEWAAETGVALANPTETPINLTLVLLDTQGREVARRAPDFLNPLGQRRQVARFVHELFSDVAGLGGFRGRLTVEAATAGEFAATGLVQDAATGMLSALPVINGPSDSAGSLDRYFAQMADGGGFHTTFALMNESEQPAMGQLRLYNPDGTPRSLNVNGTTGSQFPVDLPLNGTVFLSTSNKGSQARPGWAVLETGNRITGVATFDWRGADQRLLYRVSVFGEENGREFVLPVQFGTHLNTGVAIANPGDKELTVELKLRPNGTNDPLETGLPLGPGKQSAKFIDELFGAGNVGSSLTGVLTVQVPGGTEGLLSLTGLVLEEGLLSAVPVIRTREGAGAGSLYAADPIVGNLRFVPGGTFTQGSPPEEACRESDESQFTHQLTRNLAVMETEVTQGMWKALAAPLPPDPSNFIGDDNRPVERVTWYEAVLFANLLSLHRGYTPVYYTNSAKTNVVDTIGAVADSVYMDPSADGFRLPTEGEWEYFARASTTGPYSVNETNYNSSTCYICASGELPALQSVAWFCPNSEGTTHPVGMKGANPWNLKDVHGNVWEWVWDWYGTYPTGTVQNYIGPASSPYSGRVIRGGGRYFAPSALRSASRGGLTPGSRRSTYGFRLLRSVN